MLKFCCNCVGHSTSDKALSSLPVFCLHNILFFHSDLGLCFEMWPLRGKLLIRERVCFWNEWSGAAGSERGEELHSLSLSLSPVQLQSHDSLLCMLSREVTTAQDHKAQRLCSLSPEISSR